MKKLILILGASLILTGCSKSDSTSIVLENNSYPYNMVEGVDYGSSSKEKTIYINEDMSALARDINKLREKYKDYMDGREYELLYIDIYRNGNLNDKNLIFDNVNSYGDEYFYDLVEILDGSIAWGLEDYIIDMKDKQLNLEEVITEKIGRTVVYVQNRGGGEENYISVKINILDVEDEYYAKVYNSISDDKYILDDLIVGEDLNLIEFVNPNNYNYYYDSDSVKVRYNMFLQDKDIEKVNILIQGKKEAKLKDDDIDVFINLLNNLDLSEEDKDRLVDEYKNLLETKSSNKKISLDNYDLYINYNKGNYSGKIWEHRYFSIERK